MDDMREIIDERTVEMIMRILAVAGPLLGLAVGGLLGAVRKEMRYYLPRGLAVGGLGVLNFGLWRLYNYLTRYDPQTRYFGLEKVSVLALNLLIFTAVGVIIGLLWAQFAPPRPSGEEAPASGEAEAEAN
jgi:hypothetical protein